MKNHKKITAAVLAAMMCMSSIGFGNMLENSFKNHSITASAATNIWDGTVDTSWYDGEEAEMHISTAEEFAGFAKLVAGGNKMEGQTIILDKDVYLNDLSEMEADSETTPTNIWDISDGVFNGTFDGGNHTIYGFYSIESSLFYHTNYNSVIKNILIDDAKVQSGKCESVLCYYNCGTIQNCKVAADVDVGGSFGMICNDNSGTIDSCESNGRITSSYRSHTDYDVNGYVGGICARGDRIINCTNNTTISGDYAGGIVGKGESFIQGCINNGDVKGRCSGGIASSSKSTISDCINNGTITGEDVYSVGSSSPLNSTRGIIAQGYGNIVKCGNNGLIQLENGGTAGGIAGNIMVRKNITTKMISYPV